MKGPEAESLRRCLAVLVIALTGLSACAELREAGIAFEPPQFPQFPAFNNPLQALGSRQSLLLIEAVGPRPVEDFAQNPHIGVTVLTQGYSRRPFFIASPAQVSFTPKNCQAVYFAADRSGRTPILIDNLLLIDMEQAGRRQFLGLGTSEPVRYLSRDVPWLTVRAARITPGATRLDRLLEPGLPVELTVTALDNGEQAQVSDIYLILETLGAPVTDENGVTRCPPSDRFAAEPALSEPKAPEPAQIRNNPAR